MYDMDSNNSVSIQIKGQRRSNKGFISRDILKDIFTYQEKNVPAQTISCLNILLEVG